ncbi:MAG: chemotaxis response regulator protein-glutamate methylesterase [Zoogloeaceae bacterium]|jgi:two-component system chemotaxis response regulator CheB|nr:chemotaxis response regulator protein-glutamate methylesterase [Zoogloeaceae bacterium]
MKIRVLVVDDSLFMRKRLIEIINAAPDMEVVGSAPDAEAAREMIAALNPDVLTLDVQMPKTTGLEFLEQIMRERPIRVVMVSAFTLEGSQATLKALELGAIDFISKPRADTLQEYGRELAEKIRTARMARLPLRLPPHTPSRLAPPVKKTLASATPPVSGASVRNEAGRASFMGAGKVIFLGASTGGTEAIKKFLLGVPAQCPPILMVQHMPETFTPSFAARLNDLCQPRVLESQGGEVVTPGTVYLAPGHSHLRVRREGAGLVTELAQTEPVNRHRPSVDVLFDAAAALMGSRAVGVILTGMGKDGAQGLLKMRQAGARTFGQDEASCVVYGMPKEAFLIGAVEEVASIDQMAARVLAQFGIHAL